MKHFQTLWLCPPGSSYLWEKTSTNMADAITKLSARDLSIEISFVKYFNCQSILKLHPSPKDIWIKTSWFEVASQELVPLPANPPGSQNELGSDVFNSRNLCVKKHTLNNSGEGATPPRDPSRESPILLSSFLNCLHRLGAPRAMLERGETYALLKMSPTYLWSG
jgi:hypothetical protein